MENVKCKIACGRGGGEKGSALLIVLGMFAFMLVSAVAFSMYMRASRAPSSYVRRNASARQLVKAALARAIDEVDTAIGNDPFPGVGRNNNCTGQVKKTRADSQPGPTNDRGAYDNWHGRVFTPKDEVRKLDEDETVSTLTLEGLGYLPPCLVNEVRYWSRHTRTARMKKQPFSYGLGRYAFTAVNVSDFFDVNNFGKTKDGKIHQYLNRSSAPHGRISPTYLFRGGETAEMIAGAGVAKDFLDDMASGVGGGGDYPSVSDVPFVSLMDFYLSVGAASKWSLPFPFYNLIGTDKSNSDVFFSSGDKDKVRHSVFMAGGWSCDTNLAVKANDYLTKYKKLNLRYPEHQPFYGFDWVMKGDATLKKCYDTGTDFWKTIEPQVPVLAIALMCDYLDCDSLPLSLCIPTVEAVPMLCGVHLNDNSVQCDLLYEKGEPKGLGQNPDGSEKMERIDKCSMRIKVQFEPSVCVVYPFANGSPGASDDFSVECYARIFFEEESSLADDNLEEPGLRASAFALSDTLNWCTEEPFEPRAQKEYVEVKCKCRNVVLPSFPKPESVQDESAAEDREKMAVVPDLEGRQDGEVTVELATLTFVTDDTGKFKFDHANDSDAFCFYNHGNFTRDGRVKFDETFKGDSGTVNYRPTVAFWMLIKDKAGNIVDMAPAIPAYDKVNARNKDNVDVNGFNQYFGGTAPALRFFPKKDGGDGIQPDRKVFSEGDSGKRATIDSHWKNQLYMVNDPRYNWAPEQWYAQASGNPRDLWFKNVKSFREGVGKDWCDPDIFMSVSDQGYLQSMYEFMMLPMTDSMISKAGPEWGAFELNSASEFDGTMKDDVSKVAYNKLMWRTYRAEAFQKDSGAWDIGYLEEMPVDEADNGLRVNPYTDNMNVMLGAFANMPCDWWSAGTNYLVTGKDYMEPGKSFEKENLFEWSYKDIDNIKNGAYNMAYFWSNAFKRRFEKSDKAKRDKLCVTDDWKDIFDDAFYWYGGEVEEKYRGCLALDPDRDLSAVADSGAIDNSAVDKILKSLTSVDRKFLYGYLKGCFANTSQLFLFFVRAEASIGGAAGDGARAVALVWRDPNPPTGTNGKLMDRDGNNGSVEVDSTDKATDNSFVYSPDVTSWRYDRREFPPHRTRILFYHQFD